MQIKQFCFYFSMLFTSQIILTSFPAKKKKLLAPPSYDATITNNSLEEKVAKLEAATNQLTSANLQRLAQDSIIKNYIQQQFDQINTDMQQLSRSKNITTQPQSLNPHEIEDLRKKITLLTDTTETSFPRIFASLASVKRKIEKQNQVTNNIEQRLKNIEEYSKATYEHIRAIHESRQRLEQSLEERFNTNSARIFFLNSELDILKQRIFAITTTNK